MADVTVQLPVHRWGTGGRRALLVHGLASSGATWWRIAEGLAAAGFDVTAPDLRGHGAAPTPTDYRFADFARDLRVLSDDWDLLVGHSLGGPIACALLGLGARAAHTVLLDPVFEIEDDALAEVAADQASEADPFADPAAIARQRPSWHPLDAHHKAMAARAVSGWTVERVMAQNAPWHHRSLLAHAAGPVSLLGADPAVFTMCPPELGRELAEAHADVTYRTVAGVGHSVQREAPDAVLAACLAPG